MNFYVGQEVVCINDSFRSIGLKIPPIKKGKHYVISGIKQGCCHLLVDIGLSIELTQCTCGKFDKGPEWWILASRFAPLESIPASHEIAVKKLIEESQTILN